MAVVDVTRTEAAPRRENLIIGLDCDGVLASDHELWEALYAAFPDCIPPAYSMLASYEWPRSSPETTALCLRLSADPAFTRRLRPLPAMAWAIRALHQRGWEIHIITARPAAVHAATLDWLEDQQVGHLVTAVHCAEVKAPVAQELGCSVFVEDNPRTAEIMGALGLRSYLLNTCYNQCPTVQSIRVAGWPSLISDLTAYQWSLQPEKRLSPLAIRKGRLLESARTRLADALLPGMPELQPAV
jgi:uncharacterized HAD superfamily protein